MVSRITVTRFAAQPSNVAVAVLARDAFVGTIRRAVAVMFVRLSGTVVYCDHTCTLPLISVHGWIVQCSTSGHPNTKPKRVHLLSTVFLQFHLEDRCGMNV